MNQLRAFFRKSRGRFVQEHALELVEKGSTSVQEVLRAMRGQEQDPQAAKIAASQSNTGSFTSTGSAAGQSRPRPPQGPAKPPKGPAK